MKLETAEDVRFGHELLSKILRYTRICTKYSRPRLAAVSCPAGAAPAFSSPISQTDTKKHSRLRLFFSIAGGLVLEPKSDKTSKVILALF
jgi:hypothetical protein